MEDSSAYVLGIKREFKLSTQLAMVLELLLKSNIVTRGELEPLYSTFYGDKPYHNVDRMILYRLRKRLGELDILVFNQYGEGYYLKSADKSYLRGVLEGIV